LLDGVATINYRDTPSQIPIREGPEPPHLAIPLRWVWRMRFKVEIEARQASRGLWIPSTLVFKSLKTRFRVVVIYWIVKERWVLSTPDAASSTQKKTRQCSIFYFSIRWSVRDSNPRPPACKADALPAELTPQSGAPGRTACSAVGLERFELSTPRLSSVCSNQLSYRPRLKVWTNAIDQIAKAPVGPSKLNSKIEKNESSSMT
jgi:hypothetical protein